MADRIVLGTWPTPLEPAPRLAAAVGLAADALWVKRDDLSGLGGGGNKVRKLQYTCAQALTAGATTVITSGAPQSNHARLTAAAAARLGFRSVLVLQGEEPEVPAGNLVLDLLAGARLVWTGPATAEQTRREVDRPGRPGPTGTLPRPGTARRRGGGWRPGPGAGRPRSGVPGRR